MQRMVVGIFLFVLTLFLPASNKVAFSFEQALHEKTTVVVTGASGHLGITLLEELLTNKHLHVKALYCHHRDRLEQVLKRLNSQGIDTQGRVELFQVNVESPETLAAVFAGAQVVIHLAAVISIFEDPAHYQEMCACNVLGTRNVLAATKKAGIKTFIHCSSTHAYRHLSDKPLSRENGLHLNGTSYDATKARSQELVAEFAKHEEGFSYVIVAPSAIVGRNDHSNDELWPIFERSALVRLGPVPTGGYAFVDVRQLSKLLHKALFQLLSQETRETINGQEFIVAGQMVSLAELFRTLQAVTHKHHCLNWGWGNEPVQVPLFLLKQIAPLIEKTSALLSKKSPITRYSMNVLSSLPHGVAAEEQRKVEQFFGEEFRPLPLADTIADRFATQELDRSLQEDASQETAGKPVGSSVVTGKRKIMLLGGALAAYWAAYYVFNYFTPSFFLVAHASMPPL